MTCQDPNVSGVRLGVRKRSSLDEYQSRQAVILQSHFIFIIGRERETRARTGQAQVARRLNHGEMREVEFPFLSLGLSLSRYIRDIRPEG